MFFAINPCLLYFGEQLDVFPHFCREMLQMCDTWHRGLFLLPVVFAYVFVSGSPVSCFPSYMALNNQFGKAGNKSKPQIVM